MAEIIPFKPDPDNTGVGSEDFILFLKGTAP